jgi:hypothetical protein
MKHVRCVTIPRMAIEQKADTYKQDSLFGPIIAVGKLVALVGGTFLGISSLLSGFRTEL